MNNVLSLVQATRSSPNPHPALYSEHMLAELLALHGEMIEQLRLERLGSADCVDFLTGLIDQHEKTAEMLRAKLENFDADSNEGALANLPERPARVRPRPLSRVSPRSSLFHCRSSH